MSRRHDLGNTPTRTLCQLWSGRRLGLWGAAPDHQTADLPQVRFGGKADSCEDAGFIALNDPPGISLPMVSLMRVLTSRIGAPLPGKLANALVLIRSTAVMLALMIGSDSGLSWLGLDAVMSAPWRSPVWWFLFLVAFTLIAREIAENLHREALEVEEEHRQRNALERL